MTINLLRINMKIDIIFISINNIKLNQKVFSFPSEDDKIFWVDFDSFKNTSQAFSLLKEIFELVP